MLYPSFPRAESLRLQSTLKVVKLYHLNYIFQPLKIKIKAFSSKIVEMRIEMKVCERVR